LGRAIQFAANFTPAWKPLAVTDSAGGSTISGGLPDEVRPRERKKLLAPSSGFRQ
jgi:hypothetical protein